MPTPAYIKIEGQTQGNITAGAQRSHLSLPAASAMQPVCSGVDHCRDWPLTALQLHRVRAGMSTQNRRWRAASQTGLSPTPLRTSSTSSACWELMSVTMQKGLFQHTPRNWLCQAVGVVLPGGRRAAAQGGVPVLSAFFHRPPVLHPHPGDGAAGGLGGLLARHAARQRGALSRCGLAGGCVDGGGVLRPAVVAAGGRRGAVGGGGGRHHRRGVVHGGLP